MDNSEQMPTLCRNIRYLREIHEIRHHATKSEYGILLRLHREFHIPLSTLFSCDLSGSA